MRAAGLAVIVALALTACGDMPLHLRGWHSARSERSHTPQVDDRVLETNVRTALARSPRLDGASITPYVYMGHVFLVGFVVAPDQHDTATDAAREVEGVRSVNGYLPIRSRSDGSLSLEASDQAIEGQVKAALALAGQAVTHVELDVLDGHVVLLGVVASQEVAAAATATAREVNGVKGVTNFLLLPEPGYEHLRPGIG